MAGAIIALSLVSEQVAAKTHTWIPNANARQHPQQLVLPTVTITGHITYGSGDFDQPFDDAPNYSNFGLGTAVADAHYRAVELSDVCRNPVISASAKQVTAASDTTTRWLSAQEAFNTIAMKGYYAMYQGSFGANGIAILMNGVKYAGFKVKYSDGSQETWAIMPNYASSTVKLFDSPLPNSLTAPTKSGC